MEMRLYTIFDRVAEECGPVYEAKNDAIAARNFKQVLGTVPKVDLDAFDLVCLGAIERDTMRITLMDPPNILSVSLEELYKAEKDEKNAG